MAILNFRIGRAEPIGAKVRECHMGDGNMIMGLVMALISLIELILASNAVDTAFYLSGLTLFRFGVFFIYSMILKYGAGGKKA